MKSLMVSTITAQGRERGEKGRREELASPINLPSTSWTATCTKWQAGLGRVAKGRKERKGGASSFDNDGLYCQSIDCSSAGASRGGKKREEKRVQIPANDRFPIWLSFCQEGRGEKEEKEREERRKGLELETIPPAILIVLSLLEETGAQGGDEKGRKGGKKKKKEDPRLRSLNGV